MNLQQIKQAVANGETVHWSNKGYTVTKGLQICHRNGSCVGLTWTDEVTLNGSEWQFYLADNGPVQVIEQLYRHICHELETVNGTSSFSEVISLLDTFTGLLLAYPSEAMEDVWYIDTYMSIGITDMVVVGAYWFMQNHHQATTNREHVLSDGLVNLYTPNMATEPDADSEADEGAYQMIKALQDLKAK